MDSPTISALLQQAQTAYASKEYVEAASLFGQAADLLDRTGDSLGAAEQKNNQSVALVQAGKANEAYQACLGTAEIFAQQGDIRRQALALGNQAAALEALGRQNEALALYTQCAALLKQVGDKENRSQVLAKISALQLRKGQQLEALTSMSFALDQKKDLSLKERFLKWLLNVPIKMITKR